MRYWVEIVSTGAIGLFGGYALFYLACHVVAILGTVIGGAA